MSEAKFTKYPWVVFYPHEILNSGHVSVESESGQHIYTVEVYNSNLEEHTANAHLIAAAPEMYEILEDYVSFAERGDIEGFNQMFCIVKELLAKVRGEK